MRLLALCLVLSACGASPTPAPRQTGGAGEAEVMAVVQRLFDGMRAGDSAVVRSVFHPDATLATVMVREGEPVLRNDGGIDGFVEAVGQPHEQVWDERIYNPVVLIDGHLASVWVDYTFHLGETFSHCGVDAFQLFRGADGWRIFHLADTRRQEGCEALLAEG